MMGASYWQNPIIFLLNTAFTLYILTLMIRVLLQLGGNPRDRFNPLVRFLEQVTEPVIGPLRYALPPYKGVDLSAIVVMFALQLAYYGAVLLVVSAAIPIPVLLRGAIVDLLLLLLNLYLFSILIQVILSWVSPGTYHPALGVLYAITGPIMEPFQRLLPPMGGLDFSPLIALVVIQVLKMLIAPFGLPF